VKGITGRSVNNLRRIMIDTPQHLAAVLSGDISLQAAVVLRRKMRTQQKLNAFRVINYSEVRWRLPIALIAQLNLRAQREGLTLVELVVRILRQDLSK
jgi:hypothetical protein